MGKRLSQLNQINQIDDNYYLLVDKETESESKKIQFKNIKALIGNNGSSVTVDPNYDPKSENAQSGIAVAEALSDKVTVYKGIDISMPPMAEFIIVEEEFNGVGILLPYKEGDIYINTDEDCAYQCVSVDSGTNGGNRCTFKRLNNRVDQIYDSESYNAQSGKAVSQAIANIEISGGGSNLTVVSTLQEFKTAIANNCSPIMFKEGIEIILGETIVLPANTVLIGNNVKIKRANGYDGNLLSLREDCKVSDLKIDGNRENTVSPTWDNTIEISTRARCVIENVVIENGNECIICYGDDVIVKHCQITNCGNSAIHFSGANRTRVENCTIIGTNKKSGMGHDEGAIIWSNSCDYVTCTDNYIEDAKSAFGAIDQDKNSHLKIIGNTAKNCQRAIFSKFTGLTNEAVPTNIIISNNHFISCDGLTSEAGIEIHNTNAEQGRKVKNVIISDNILENCGMYLKGLENLVVTNNITIGGKITVLFSPKAIIMNNNVNNWTNSGIYVADSKYANISNNFVRCTEYCVYLSRSPFSIISKNFIRQQLSSSGSNLLRKLNSNGTTIEGNKMVLYAGNCVNVQNGDIVTNNHIDCANTDSIAIRIYGGVTGAIAEKNLTNGTFAISNPLNGFAGNNFALPETEFLSVTFTLTNITTNGIAKVLNGDTYTCTLTANEGYSLPETISVTIGTDVITNFTYNASTGEIVIPNVTGAVTITAEGV